jgi:hypothetical protein
MSDADEEARVEWVTLDEAPNHPAIRQLIPTQRAWYWELGKPNFKRRMVEAGAILKIGKSWRVSLIKAPETIERIYREASLAAIERAATSTKVKRQKQASTVTA